MPTPLITNDAVVLGLLALVLGAVFYTKSKGGAWDKFLYFLSYYINVLSGAVIDEHIWADPFSVFGNVEPVAGRERLLPAG